MGLEAAFRFQLFVEIGNFGPEPGEVFLAAEGVAADHAFDGPKGLPERIEAAGGFILGFAALRAGDGDEFDGHALSISSVIGREPRSFALNCHAKVTVALREFTQLLYSTFRPYIPRI